MNHALPASPIFATIVGKLPTVRQDGHVLHQYKGKGKENNRAVEIQGLSTDCCERQRQPHLQSLSHTESDDTNAVPGCERSTTCIVGFEPLIQSDPNLELDQHDIPPIGTRSLYSTGSVDQRFPKDAIQTLPELEGDDTFVEAIDSFIAKLKDAPPETNLTIHDMDGDRLSQGRRTSANSQDLPFRSRQFCKQLSDNDKKHLEHYMKKAKERETQFQAERRKVKELKSRIIRTRSEERIARGEEFGR